MALKEKVQELLRRSTPKYLCPTCDALNPKDVRIGEWGEPRHYPCPIVSGLRGEPTAAEYPLRDIGSYPTREEYVAVLKELLEVTGSGALT